MSPSATTSVVPTYSPPESPLTHIIPVDLGSQSTVSDNLPNPHHQTADFNSYLTAYAREAIETAESPVHLLIRIMASEMKNDVQQISDLHALSMYFVADVVADILHYYKELASSWPIPQTYLQRCSLVQIAESIALELRAYSTVGSHGFGDKENNRGMQGNQGSQVGRSGQRVASGQGGGDGGGRGGQGVGGGPGGQGGGGGGDRGGQGGGRGGRVGRGRGGGGRGQGGCRGHVQYGIVYRPESKLFQDIAHTIIPVETFVTPKKKSHNQRQIVQQAARKFLLDPTVVTLQGNAYDPYEEITARNENKNRLLFHGTRKSKMWGFRTRGVGPAWRANEMSDGPAFYTTNSIQQAVAHVLYAHPKVQDLPVDPIVVLVFSVDITILHGDQPPPGSSSKFLVNWYKHDSDVHRNRFIEDAKYNLGLTSPSEVISVDNVQIGPICLLPEPVILGNWTDDCDCLTQVAACSVPVFNFFSDSLTMILEEKRIENMVPS